MRNGSADEFMVRRSSKSRNVYQCVKSRWPDVLFAAKWTHGACASSRESARHTTLVLGGGITGTMAVLEGDILVQMHCYRRAG